MTKTTKILIIVGCAVSGALNGCVIAFPESAVMFSGINAGIALIFAAITGVSLAKG